MRFDKRILTNMVWAVLTVCLLLFPPAMAQSGGQYELSWSTSDGDGKSVRAKEPRVKS